MPKQSKFFKELYEDAETSVKYHQAGVRLEFAEAFSSAIREYDIPERVLIEKSGLSKRRIKALLRCESKIDDEIMAKLALAFGAEFRFLLMQKPAPKRKRKK